MISSIAKQLQQARIHARLTQAELAARLGLSRPTLTQIEGGKATTTRVLEAWASACGVEVRIVKTRPDLAQQVEGLQPHDQELVEHLLRVLPILESADRRTLLLLFEGWVKEIHSEGGQENVKTKG